MKSFTQFTKESTDDPRTGYPEFRGQMGKADSSHTPDERKKIHNNPKVGDVVSHGETGHFGKVAKVEKDAVHVQYKGTKSTVRHDRNEHIFHHDRTYNDGTRKYQVAQM
jgi:hypothetical protein